VLSLVSPLPVAVASDRSYEGRRIVAAEIARAPDVVVADFPHATVLLPPTAVPVVLFTHNVEAEICHRHADVAANPVLRAMWTSQTRKMKAFEEKAARSADGVVVVSSRDAAHFRSVARADRVFMIPTGVDLDYFQYAPCRTKPPVDGGTIVFSGSMDWSANVDGIRYFMDEVWPRMIAVRPNLIMVVIGHSPPRALIQAAAERRLAWKFTGFVDDVRVHSAGAHVYVIPLRVGGGTRIKAFEAMAMGCPVVSSSIGIEGLPVVSGRHFLGADTPAAFADAVLSLLGDTAARNALSERARALVEQRFSHRAAAAAFEEACLRTHAFCRPAGEQATEPALSA
jgi:glycosyltransferase involved in cell wall biosynthesis